MAALPLSPTPSPDERLGLGGWRDGLPRLIGERVILREPLLADAEAFVTSLAPPEVARFMAAPPSTVHGFEQFIAWLQSARVGGRCACFAIVPRATGRAVGVIQLRALEPGFQTAEWGFALGPEFWGTGLFVESATMVLDYAFRHVGVHRLEARASIDNLRGNGVLAKLGAACEGRLRRSLQLGTDAVDQTLWAILQEEWLQRRAPVYQVAPIVTSLETVEGNGREPCVPGWCAGPPSLQGHLCTLRELAPEDDRSLIDHLSHPEVQRYAPPPPETTHAFQRFREWTRRAREEGRHLCLGVVPRDRQEAVGLIQVRALSPSFRTAEWGFALGRPYWGTGVFIEAASLVVDFVFDTVGVHRLEARTLRTNLRACHVLDRMGAVFEGSLRQSFLLGGQFHDDALYSLLREDWRERRDQLLARLPTDVRAHFDEATGR